MCQFTTNYSTDETPIWEWQDDDNSLKSFDSISQEILETAFEAQCTSVDLNHGEFGKRGGYTIDLENMTQTNKKTGTPRKILRRTRKEIRTNIDNNGNIIQTYWEWSFDDTGSSWSPYAKDASTLIERDFLTNNRYLQLTFNASQMSRKYFID